MDDASTSAPTDVAPFPADQLIHREVSSGERLDTLARDMSVSSLGGEPCPTSRAFVRALRRIERELAAARAELAATAGGPDALTPDVEWLLDNFHVIEGTVREVRTDLPPGYYCHLPAQITGPFAGWPRVYELAAAVVSHTDGAIDEGLLRRFVRVYQEACPLTIGELWAVPTMLRLALLEALRRLADRSVRARRDRAAATTWVRDRGASVLPEDPSDSFVVGVCHATRDSADPILWDEVVHWLGRVGANLDDARLRDRQRQAADQVSIGNCVTSLRVLNAIDWPAFFESESGIEETLRTDPGGVYPRQDFATRDECRRAVERLARGSDRFEHEIADLAVAAARRHAGDPRRGHVAYHLIGAGFADLAAAVDYRPRWGEAWRQRLLHHPHVTYFGLLGTFFAVALAVALLLAGPSSVWSALAVAAAASIPLSELAVALVNILVCRLVPPRVLAKLDLRTGLPEGCTTVVAIPCLFSGPDGVRWLLERLELHYLANPDANLCFALLSDFSDAPAEEMPEDEALLALAVEGIRQLNERHTGGGPDRFYLFHRRRQFNPVQGRWMGWERKRGKLSEFNRLLRGATDTSFVVRTGDPATKQIRYVLTLDADTVLPKDAAQRLIGTLAHPLNAAEVSADGRRVVAGYGVLQPRVAFLYRTGFRSLFARWLAGSAGVDPYSAATSDTYMDLFGRGTFTGKGLYDVDAFEATAGHAFPENHILSHDLIEGNFARCGLVSDVEVYDDFPSQYHAFARREHRWIRGDWQLLPWLGRRVPTASGAYEPNVLPALERWKIFDNLRRSLVPIAVVSLLALGWTVLPGGPWLWSALAALVVFQTLAVQFALTLRDLLFCPARGAVVRQARYSLGHTAGQVLLSGVFLANQALIALDAITRTLWRMFVSRRNLLEWETAAAAEARLGSGWRTFISQMWGGVILSLAVAGLVGIASPGALPAAAPWLASWLLAPLVAWWVSRPLARRVEAVDDREQRLLRRLARKTWLFFETFVGPDDHWLPPDNYQEEPGAKVAHRTSPTNIGLYLLSCLSAHDLGYLTTSLLTDRLTSAFDTLDRLEKYRGHLLNWYDTKTLAVLQPAYVSTVDSGNFLACLLTLRHGLYDIEHRPVPNPALQDGLADTLVLIEESLRQLPERSPALSWLGPQAVALRADLAVRPQTLSDWSRWLGQWSDRVAEWVVRLRKELLGHEPVTEWVDRLGRELRSAQLELEAVCPWVSVLSSLPQEPGQDELHGRLGEVFKELNTPRSLANWSERLPELQSEVSAWPGESSRTLTARLAESRADKDLAVLRKLFERAGAMADRMDFRFLYNSQRDLYSIGFHVPHARLDNSYYDLLASEASLTSFLLVARGEAPKKHWFALGRPPIRVKNMPGLLSWGGTMFEYLLPRLVLPIAPGTFLDSAQRVAVHRQIEYGQEVGLPWGVSESAYSRTDLDQNYQYYAFGVPGLGLKRGLGRDLVVAPYATALAVQVEPRAAVLNLHRLAEAGGEGRYGLYEAIDFTAERLPPGADRVVVRTYMAHHQGMIFTALANRLLGDLLPARMAREPAVRAVEPLLHERVPYTVPTIEPPDAHGESPVRPEDALAIVRRIATAATPAPRIHVLSNATYTAMVTNAGGGFATCKGVDVYRWRNDRTCDHAGHTVYIRDPGSGEWWPAGSIPGGRKPDGYEVLYSIDKAELRRSDGNVLTVQEVVVCPERNAEVRRVTLTNHGPGARSFELTSYLEPVLLPHATDLAHPAFGKLFLETEWVPGLGALLCRRRPRSSEQRPTWVVHVIASDQAVAVDYETDRARFIGRRRSSARPAALQDEEPLSGATGPVLDPVLAIRFQVRAEPESSVTASFTTAYAESREEALELAETFRTPAAVARTFDLAWAHARVELQQLNLTARQAHLFQRLAGHCLFPSPTMRHAPARTLNRRGQPGLWPFGISGDAPIVLVRIEKGEHLELTGELLAAQRYLRGRQVSFDLILLDERPSSYREELIHTVASLMRDDPGTPPGLPPARVFPIRADQVADEERLLLLATAAVVLADSRGGLADQLDSLEPVGMLPPRLRTTAPVTPPDPEQTSDPGPLLFDNGTGGFSSDGREYVIKPGAVPPAPWSNVIANPRLGFLVTDSGGGYTWAGNSQLNRLTPWSNDPVSDPPGEVVYLRDEASGEVWTPTPLPRGGPTTVRHGAGYTRFTQVRDGLEVSLLVFVAPDDPVKLLCLRVRNTRSQPRLLSATFYVEWVLGTTREQSANSIVTEEDPSTGALFAHSGWNPDFAERVAFADVSRRPRTATASRGEFIGRLGDTSAPEALSRAELSGRMSSAADPCAAVQTKFSIRGGQSQDVVFVLGQAEDRTAARHLATKYRDPRAVEDALAQVGRQWDEILGTIRVKTPDPALDLLLNRWLVYQTLACRVWGRSGFYQSGGAYGFRDQLQDVMALVYARPEETRVHILRAAGRQFPEGDVQHWWHPPAGRGVRTRFSDDFLFLPFVACFYSRVTGNLEVFDEVVPFLRAPRLGDDQHEHYGLPEVSTEAASVYEHCLRALNHGWKLGAHGLPLMGIGDWNDGMSRVGVGGKGESVWVAWFQTVCLTEFAAVAERRGDEATANECRRRVEHLREALETAGWDGDWYRRAYYDDGTPLGTATNDECRIDSITQSWSAISGVGDPERADRAVSSAVKHLVRPEDRLVLLFAPPFDQTDHDPGYIKGYLPGVRENGGQYTHAAAWLVQALARLDRPDEAATVFNLLNPVYLADNPEKVERYRVEPYVVAADVYGMPPHIGLGGWTWYTGSAGWVYRVALEELLGFRKAGSRLNFDPRLPTNWNGYALTYRYGGTEYRVQVIVDPDSSVPLTITLNGKVIEEIELVDDGAIYQVVVRKGLAHSVPNSSRSAKVGKLLA